MPNRRICYKVFSTTSATESEAVSSCSDENARLAVVDTEDKYNFFTNLTQPYNPSKLNFLYITNKGVVFLHVTRIHIN